ncbi:hypothetical protein [Virgibacillus siamensis]|nr:hypothetical protein [Virgibacillus siamensis]
MKKLVAILVITGIVLMGGAAVSAAPADGGPMNDPVLGDLD